MKIEYLIHEYTWSNHCISGNKLGWGIVASSIPEDRTYLRELEKVAQAAVVDKTGRIEVEELVYSPVCGFVKMTSIPCESGEDKRQNKRVRLYQPKAPDHNPAVYLAPGIEWTEGESTGFLPTLTLEEAKFDREDYESCVLKRDYLNLCRWSFGVCQDIRKVLILLLRTGRKKSLPRIHRKLCM